MQCSSSFQCECVISCNRFNTRSRNQVQVCLFVLISILRVIKSDLKKSFSCHCEQLKSDHLFCDSEKSDETQGATFARGFLRFSQCVGPSVNIEQFWLSGAT